MNNRLLPDLIIYDINYKQYFRYRQDLDFIDKFILLYDDNGFIHSLRTISKLNKNGIRFYKISQGIS